MDENTVERLAELRVRLEARGRALLELVEETSRIQHRMVSIQQEIDRLQADGRADLIILRGLK